MATQSDAPMEEQERMSEKYKESQKDVNVIQNGIEEKEVELGRPLSDAERTRVVLDQDLYVYTIPTTDSAREHKEIDPITINGVVYSGLKVGHTYELPKTVISIISGIIGCTPPPGIQDPVEGSNKKPTVEKPSISTG